MKRLWNSPFTYAALATVDTVLFVGRGQPVAAAGYLAFAIIWLLAGVRQAVAARP